MNTTVTVNSVFPSSVSQEQFIRKHLPKCIIDRLIPVLGQQLATWEIYDANKQGASLNRFLGIRILGYPQGIQIDIEKHFPLNRNSIERHFPLDRNSDESFLFINGVCINYDPVSQFGCKFNKITPELQEAITRFKNQSASVDLNYALTQNQEMLKIKDGPTEDILPRQTAVYFAYQSPQRTQEHKALKTEFEQECEKISSQQSNSHLTFETWEKSHDDYKE